MAPADDVPTQSTLTVGAKPDRSHRLAQLFEAAMSLHPEELPGFLERECGADTPLRQELEELLAVDRAAMADLGSAPLDAQPTVADVAPQTRPVSALCAGLRIHQYELIRELGHGGMGTVYLSRDTQLGRCVAIKFLHSDAGALTERFLVEARLTARCSHDNIVVIHEVAEHDNMPFMVLEYLRGHTLRQELSSRAVPVSRAAQLMVPVVRALVCAHDLGIVHRDLKPDNVFVTEAGTVKVLDFGIAKVLSAKYARAMARFSKISLGGLKPHNMAKTSYGTLIGTMPYMAPEQWRGEVDLIDHRTDLWAIGIMLYEMTTGRHPLAPLQGQHLAVTGVRDQPMPSIGSAGVDLPPEFADAVDRCLRKPIALRMNSARELQEILEQYLPGRNIGDLPTDDSPYPGLEAFQEVDAPRFFGRSRDIAYLVARLREQPMMGIVGPSGVGKSSFVRAGVVPALKNSGDNWEAFILRPGRQPLWALASRLITAVTSRPLSSEQYELHALVGRLRSEPGYAGRLLRNWAETRRQKVLLFVDQFEELYTLVHDPAERVLFTNCLFGVADDASSPLRVVISIRSDFVDRVAEHRQFMRDLTRGLVFLPRPDRDGLREAIVEPAGMRGFAFESAQTIEHMLDTLATTPGALPLLQFAATKLWDMRDRKRKLFTEHSYERIGGVAGALASHADAVLNELHPRDQALVRTIFERLVTPEKTRAIASVSELCELSDNADDVQRLLELLVNARLLVVQDSDSEDGASVEIVHEAMIETWPCLAHWLEEHHEDLLFLEQLRTTAKQWAGSGRPRGMLWRGDAMEAARRWHRRYRGRLTKVQRQYLEAVFALAARAHRNRRLAVAGTMGFLSILVVAAAVALVWINNAKGQARAAERQARASERQAHQAAETIRQQFAQLQAARAGRAKAEEIADDLGAQVEDSNAELKRKNQALVKALAQARESEALARRESRRAREAAELAEMRAEAYRKTKAEAERARAVAERLLAKERARQQVQTTTIGAERSNMLKK